MLSPGLSPTRSAQFPARGGRTGAQAPAGGAGRQQLSEEEMQNIQLLQARSRAFSAEYELLEFSISSSRTFFV